MPNYTFLDVNTNEEFDLTMSIADRDAYVLANPHHVQQIAPSGYVRQVGIGDSAKPSQDFRNMLSSMKKHNKGSTINDF